MNSDVNKWGSEPFKRVYKKGGVDYVIAFFPNDRNANELASISAIIDHPGLGLFIVELVYKDADWSLGIVTCKREGSNEETAKELFDEDFRYWAADTIDSYYA